MIYRYLACAVYEKLVLGTLVYLDETEVEGLAMTSAEVQESLAPVQNAICMHQERTEELELLCDEKKPTDEGSILAIRYQTLEGLVCFAAESSRSLESLICRFSVLIY